MIINPKVGQRIRDLCFYPNPIGTIIEIRPAASYPHIIIYHDSGGLGSFPRGRFPHELNALTPTPEDEEQYKREIYADQYL